MNPSHPRLGTLLTLLTLAAGCGHDRARQAPLSPAPVRARLAAVEALTASRPVPVYGVVQPARQAFVSGRVMGSVVAVHVQPGARVSRGQPLLEVQPDASNGQVAQARGALAQAQAALALAEHNFRRFEALHAEKAASELELDMARMQLEQARGAVEQAQGAVQAASAVADDAVVRAPFAARVVETLVEVGDLAAPGRPLVRVESLEGREIWLDVRAAEIEKIAVGTPVTVRLDSRTDLGAVAGAVAEVIPAADPTTHTFTVKVDLGRVEVASGLSGRAELPGGAVERLVVPAGAVHRRGGLELVVVRSAEGLARTRAVTTGALLGDGRVEILSGLAAGEQVLVDAPGPVADGAPVEVAS
jgi:RND family efflux transporter MFP subunit